MEARIIQLLKVKKLTAAQFADAIGVQRSSVSHLMSGRNKPSMDFIEKILKTFPDVNAEWLLLGKGHPIKEMDLFSRDERALKDIPGTKGIPLSDSIHDQTASDITSTEEADVIREEQHIGKSGSQKGSPSISRIVIFYSDGTFETYLPRK